MAVNNNMKYAVVGGVNIMSKMCSNPQCRCMLEVTETKCYKCGSAPMVPFKLKEDGSKHYFAYTEVVFFVGDKKDQEEHAKKRELEKALPSHYSARLFHYFDKEKNQLLPDKRVQYMPKGRKVIINYFSEPRSRAYTDSKGRLTVVNRIDLDTPNAIQFLADGKKPEAAKTEAAPITTPVAQAGITKEAILAALGLNPNMLAQLGTLVGSQLTITPPVVEDTNAPRVVGGDTSEAELLAIAQDISGDMDTPDFVNAFEIC